MLVPVVLVVEKKLEKSKPVKVLEAAAAAAAVAVYFLMTPNLEDTNPSAPEIITEICKMKILRMSVQVKTERKRIITSYLSSTTSKEWSSPPHTTLNLSSQTMLMPQILSISTQLLARIMPNVSIGI